MKLYSENEYYKLYQGNMLDMLEVIEPNSIDSIVCDPPYGLTSITKRFGKENSAECQYGKDGSFARLSKGFMGKEWDGSGIEYNVDAWSKCYEVLKPGGYLLAFGGSRTFHRIACAIEDAGFEIRDTIMWIYGAGFPKSMNVGKQLEKRLEDEKTKQKTEHDLRFMWERDLQKTKRNEKKQDEVLQSQLQKQSLQGTMYGKKSKESNLWREEPCLEGWNNIQKTERELQRCKVCEMSKRVFINGEERWICNGTQTCDGKTFREMLEQSGSCSSYRPQSKQQRNRKLNAIQEQCRTQESREVIEYWNKFGTALKPSFEPIIVARKPFKGSLVDNVIEYGVGGINIDECRVNYSNNEPDKRLGFRKPTENGSIYSQSEKKYMAGSINDNYKLGRFPANTILTYDETPSDERLRYFYCAKASKRDRDEGLEEFNDVDGDSYQFRQDGSLDGKIPVRKNTHPTVKPTELMQYLVRLVSPNGATILDPFNGSGSTGKAVMYENKERNKNYKYIGIELTEEYLPIAKARIEYVCNLEEDKLKDMQMSIFDMLGDNINE